MHREARSGARAARREGSRLKTTAARRDVDPTCSLTDRSSSNAANLCITFGNNSAVLTQQARETVGQLAKAMTDPELRARKLTLAGFTNSVGNDRSNLLLSERRAVAVADYLASLGVERERIDARGYGASQFLPERSSNDPANRRVEARLAPQT